MKNFLLLAWLLSAAVLFAAPPIVIQNATILTVTNGVVKGSLLVRDGKIVEIGEKILVPPGAQVIEAAGQFVMPGIIDCHSHIGADSINESSVSVSSMVGIQDVLDPTAISIYRALAGGVTTANILHGSANAIGGTNSVLKMRWGKDAQGLLLAGARPGIKFALGENPKRRGGSTDPSTRGNESNLRYPATRMGVEDVIRQAFNDARAYQKEWKAYEAAKKSSATPVIPPRRDLQLEPLVEILEGKRLVHAHCYRQDEILMLLRVADEFGFKIKTLQHVLEGYKVAKEIAAHGAGASTFSDWWSYKVEAFDAIPYNAAIMVRKGVLVSLNSDSGELMRRLNTEAAKTMKYGGLTETEALSLITINPAKQLDLGDRIGSLEVGKEADIVIYDQHPLSSYAKVLKVLIDGEVYFDRDKDLAEREPKKLQKTQLIEQEKRQQQRQQPQQKKQGSPAGRRPAEQ
jgi:imidazolonepropionase-like amidohydrolase